MYNYGNIFSFRLEKLDQKEVYTWLHFLLSLRFFFAIYLKRDGLYIKQLAIKPFSILNYTIFKAVFDGFLING